MKTNYKQSQAAPHAKPIFTVSRNDSTLYVLPAYLAGAVMIRLQHIADSSKYITWPIRSLSGNFWVKTPLLPWGRPEALYIL